MTDPLAPTFLLAGAARSGTTAIVEDLRTHPDVFVTDPKEPHFLALGERPARFRGPGDEQTVNRLAVTDPDAYRALFRAAGGATARGEGSVSTLYYAGESVARMRRYAPDATVLVVLRDPVERAFSAFQYLRARGFEPLDDFEQALDEEATRIDDGWHHLWHYVAMGRYGEQLAVFADALGADRLSVFFHDDLTRDGDGVLAGIHRAIGVAPHRPPRADDRINASGEPRSALVQAVVRFPTRHPRIRAAGRRIVPYRAWQRLRAANLSSTSAPLAAHDRIRAELSTDRELLRSVLDRLGPAVHGDRPAWLD